MVQYYNIRQLIEILYWRNLMNWNDIQNFSSNIVFGVLLFAMVIYWVNLFFFKEKSFISKLGRSSTLIANVLLFFILCSRWVVAGYFPNSDTSFDGATIFAS